MTDRRGLALVLYALGAFVLLGLSMALMFPHSPAKVAERFDLEQPRRRVSLTGQASSPKDYSDLEHKNRVRIVELRKALETTARALAEQNRLLEQKDADCEALQTELDGSITLILQMLDDPAANRETSPSQVDAVKSEMKKLKSQLQEAVQLQQQQAQQVAELRDELMAAELEIAAHMEAAQIAKDQRSFEEAFTRSFVQIGEDSLPILAEFVDSENSQVRRWTARALGQMGPDFPVTRLILSELLNDSDAAVRAEATQSLELLAE